MGTNTLRGGKKKAAQTDLLPGETREEAGGIALRRADGTRWWRPWRNDEATEAEPEPGIPATVGVTIYGTGERALYAFNNEPMSTVDFEAMKALCRAAPARFDWGTKTWRVAGAPGIALIDTLAGAGFVIERHDGALAVRRELREAAARHFVFETQLGTEIDFANGQFMFRSEVPCYESTCDAVTALLLAERGVQPTAAASVALEAVRAAL